jgi:hypothetical protein
MFYSEGDGLAFLVALGDGLLGERVIVVELGWRRSRSRKCAMWTGGEKRTSSLTLSSSSTTIRSSRRRWPCFPGGSRGWLA